VDEYKMTKAHRARLQVRGRIILDVLIPTVVARRDLAQEQQHIVLDARVGVLLYGERASGVRYVEQRRAFGDAAGLYDVGDLVGDIDDILALCCGSATLDT
jgi:hypothetical protein